MSWIQRPLAINAVQLLGCELDETGRTKEVRMRAEDGGEFRLVMPLEVAAELRADLGRGLSDAELPAFRPYRGKEN
jgi:hypothetical protein